MADLQQQAILKQGVGAWNHWRRENPDEQADLSGANLAHENLAFADFSDTLLYKANLEGADLEGADLSGADLREADLTAVRCDDTNLSQADLQGADLTRAYFWTSDLSEADLKRANLYVSSFYESELADADLHQAFLVATSLMNVRLNGADVSDANLTGASLVEVDVTGARFEGSRIYGLSAWGLKGHPRSQWDLVISPMDDSPITVDNLEVAQFVYLLLKNEKIRAAIETIGKKGVLILGRFTPERKPVLDALRHKLREKDYLPMMFDFEKADNRSFTETIRLLAGLSRFIIADITKPKCVPHELQAVVPDYMVPFIPILEEGEDPYAMFVDLQRQYSWVDKVKVYRDVEQLIEKVDKAVIRPALKIDAELQLKKARGIQRESMDEY